MAHVPTSGSLPRHFSEPLERLADRVGVFGARVLWFEEVGSTNTIAVGLAERGEEEGTVVVADAQSAGRGRLGRTWASPPGAGLYMSVILRPAETMPLLTLAAGVAAANGLYTATGLTVDLKWPNDLYCGGRKVGGLLAESGRAAQGKPFVVLGIGVNVQRASLPSTVDARATSIEAELGRPVERGLIFAEVLAAVADVYATLARGGSAEVLGAWRVRAQRMLGRAVEWDEGSSVQTGRAVDIDDTGALIVETAGGTRRIVAGEVRWSGLTPRTSP
ncbi:MAG: biotin--[acetyl-CoA-carboxylase] ligase [Vicinamibacterales bacterium]